MRNRTAVAIETLGYGPAGDNGTYFQDVAILESMVSPSFTLTAGKGAPFKYLQDVVASAGRQEPRDKRHQQPSDEAQPDWNYAGAVQDMRLLAELGRRLARDPVMPACNPNERFARVRT